MQVDARDSRDGDLIGADAVLEEPDGLEAMHIARGIDDLSGDGDAPRGEHATDALVDVIEIAPRVLPGCDAASVSVQQDGEFATAASTSEHASAVDEAQYRVKQGPCLQALSTGQIVMSDDLTLDERWPMLRGEVVSVPLRSALASVVVDHRASGGAVWSLNTYGRLVGAFNPRAAEIITLLTAHVAAIVSLVFAVERADLRYAQLERAIDSRDVIGQAKGILMERHRVTADQAFDLLRQASQRLNRKLRDVADELAMTGKMPLHP